MPAARPCLKAIKVSATTAEPLPFAYCSFELLSPHVHFPPTPTLVSTHTTHSSGIYDRAPITIAPNSCALPERGGRTYTPAADSGRQGQSSPFKGSYFHPKAYEACQPEASDAVASLPPLIPDLSSSESDESDATVVTPPESDRALSPSVSIRFSTHSRHSPIPRADSQEKLDNALSFLPHPPSPAREKRRSPSRPRLARRGTKFAVADGFSQSTDDDGCLGGF
ncbi:hypothetical protein FIBSPDRAFT_851673 [Athelia psychrophila]|uniref:Uncharacterized protein n=1 Tax=Athelia psychrophila TaxID=1759441 RepID=A0A166SCK6_9AGAM|nr:hypothetical protein FIBSPDRAFT_851673 [Fibularhizoctonia sp. CBS 109695]